MKTTQLTKEEFNPFYGRYIDALGEVSLMEALVSGKENFIKLLSEITNDDMGYAYDEGKWTIAEVLLHIIDTERIFQYRALRFARKDKTDLPGFDQDDYVPNSGASSRTLESLQSEFLAVRASTILLFESFNNDMLLEQGTANKGIMSVRAAGFIISGHLLHHSRILKERYLKRS